MKRHERPVFDKSRSVSGSIWALQASQISPVGEKPEAKLLLVKDRQSVANRALGLTVLNALCRHSGVGVMQAVEYWLR